MGRRAVFARDYVADMREGTGAAGKGSGSATLSVSYAGTIRIRFKGFRRGGLSPQMEHP